MSAYKPRHEPNPTADNPLVALTTKIENLLAAESDDIGFGDVGARIGHPADRDDQKRQQPT